MKKIFFLLFFIPLISFSQTIFADFKVINDENEYLELEKLWKPYHLKMIADGKMQAWFLFKVKSLNVEMEKPPTHVTINVFKDADQLKSYTENWNETEFRTIVRSQFKNSYINKILGKNPVAENRRYLLEYIDQTIQAGGLLKVGDMITIGAMIQKSEDYESVETQIYKPYVESQILKGNHRWWGLTKIKESSENALKQFTHFTWNIPIEGKSFDAYFLQNQFISNKMAEIVTNSRDMPITGSMELIDRN
ncbi:MAG: hypothetical protein VW262_09275 [Flavobacteriaceae bacterium]|jgi:hypothetical protein